MEWGGGGASAAEQSAHPEVGEEGRAPPCGAVDLGGVSERLSDSSEDRKGRGLMRRGRGHL